MLRSIRTAASIPGQSLAASDPSHHAASSIPLSVRGTAMMSGNTAWVPNTDIYETEHDLVIKMELPGITKEDLEITLEERVLRVRGLRKDPCQGNRCCFRQLEIEYGPFERQIVIPRTVEASQVKANYHNGFLLIVLPKRQQADHDTITVIIEHD